MEKREDIFNRMADLFRPLNKSNLNTKEPEACTCDECQCYSSDGIKYAGKYFCCEECKEDYTRGVNELKDADKYDQMRDLGLESFY